jgi:hypothetical protein
MVMTTKPDPLLTLEVAEQEFLQARGWTRQNGAFGLWLDPETGNFHIDRVASNKQRQREPRMLEVLVHVREHPSVLCASDAGDLMIVRALLRARLLTTDCDARDVRAKSPLWVTDAGREFLKGRAPEPEHG